MTLPRIAVTIGDPAGIGPEIAVRAAADPALRALVSPVLVGDRSSIERAMAVTGVAARLATADQAGPDDIAFTPAGPDGAAVEYGRVQAIAGQIAWAAIQRATDLALGGRVDAVATAPLNKEALRLAGAPYIDHTTAFAGLTRSSDVLTMFVVDALRIVFATRHMSLRDACDSLTVDGLVGTVTAANDWLGAHGLRHARFALAALNPHAGENGMFGRQELDIIGPAVTRLREQGIRAEGPVAADSVFHLCRTGHYDVVISMYHDQGHIAAKTLDFERTVAVTTGLPFLRTSVDHGTAFDIAGTGTASPVSMIEAIRVAADFLGSGRADRPAD